MSNQRLHSTIAITHTRAFSYSKVLSGPHGDRHVANDGGEGLFRAHGELVPPQGRLTSDTDFRFLCVLTKARSSRCAAYVLHKPTVFEPRIASCCSRCSIQRTTPCMRLLLSMNHGRAGASMCTHTHPLCMPSRSRHGLQSCQMWPLTLTPLLNTCVPGVVITCTMVCARDHFTAAGSASPTGYLHRSTCQLSTCYQPPSSGKNR